MIEYPLLQSMESAEKMELIFSLARFNDEMKEALTMHFVQGMRKSDAATMAGVKLPNLEKQIVRCCQVNNTAHLITKA